MLLVIVWADGEDFQSPQAVPHAFAIFWLSWARAIFPQRRDAL